MQRLFSYIGGCVVKSGDGNSAQAVPAQLVNKLKGIFAIWAATSRAPPVGGRHIEETKRRSDAEQKRSFNIDARGGTLTIV